MTRPMLIAALVCALAGVLAAPAGASAAGLKLRARLNAGSADTATQPSAIGEARAMLDDNNELRIDLVYSDLAERATGAELRVGKPGEIGALVAKLRLDVEPGSGRVVGAQLEVGAEIAARIRDGESYLVVTTTQHPDGALRGQLLPYPIRLPTPSKAGD